MANYSGKFSIENGPTYNFISEKKGEKVTVSVFAYGALQGSQTLDSTTESATLYQAGSVGDYTAIANIGFDSTTKIATLGYKVEYMGQSGVTVVSGIMGSWTYE